MEVGIAERHDFEEESNSTLEDSTVEESATNKYLKRLKKYRNNKTMCHKTRKIFIKGSNGLYPALATLSPVKGYRP